MGIKSTYDYWNPTTGDDGGPFPLTQVCLGEDKPTGGFAEITDVACVVSTCVRHSVVVPGVCEDPVTFVGPYEDDQHNVDATVGYCTTYGGAGGQLPPKTGNDRS